MEVSVVTSIYHDSYLAGKFCAEVGQQVASYLNVTPDALNGRVEIILVDDGGTSEELGALLKLREQFSHVRVVELSRNFGQHKALACGFQLARGKLVVRMNVDLQDPAWELPKLLREIDKGEADLVVGCYAKRRSPWHTRLSSALYQRLFNYLTGYNTVEHSAPMRIMNRRYLDAYNALTEKTRYPQGLDAWLGFRQKYVLIQHQARADGKSSYSFRSRARMALTGILYFSERPLQLIGWLGLLMSTAGILLGVIVVGRKFSGLPVLPGYTSLIAVLLLASGLQLACLGVVAIYLGRVFRETQNRPLYVIREIYQ